jgi:hypothetical protein
MNKMKKTIADLMNHIEGEEIKDIEIHDNEIINLTKNLDLEAVKNRVMQGIQTEQNTPKNTKKLPVFKKAIALVAATLALSGTVFAAEYFDGFKFFYGGKANIALEDRASVDKTITVSGIKMTIRESVVSDKGAIIILTFEKEDGTALPKEAIIKTLDIKEHKKLAYMVNQKITEDGKKLIANFEIDSSEKLEGKKITVLADEIINTQTLDSIVKGPWKLSFRISGEAKAVEKNLNVTVGYGSEKLQLNKINVSTLGVSFDGIKTNGDIEKLPEYQPKVTITTTEGNSIELKQGSANEIKNGFRLMYDLNSEFNKVFLDISTIKNITVDDNIISIK